MTRATTSQIGRCVISSLHEMAEMILAALGEPDQPLPSVTVPTELVVRGTTGPAP